MASFTIEEMQGMQKTLQEKYKDKWEPICAEIGQNKLLWMIGEIGEVIDIVKKHGGEQASSDPDIRRSLIEEMADVLILIEELAYLLSARPELWKMRGYKIDRTLQRIKDNYYGS